MILPRDLKAVNSETWMVAAGGRVFVELVLGLGVRACQ